jgi:hypothetical protein
MLGIGGTSSLASTAPGAPASSSSQVPAPSALLGHTATPVGRNKLLVGVAGCVCVGGGGQGGMRFGGGRKQRVGGVDGVGCVWQGH